MSSLHQRAKDLFLEALAQPAGEREAFVSNACGADAALCDEVLSLLEFHEEGASAGGPDIDEPIGTVDFAPGVVFGTRYRMVTRIGRGGMGDVWQADDLVLESPVALKLIHAAGPDARQRILNEVRLARRITHPAVCRVFDFGEADGRAFYSMELVAGEDLATALRRVGRLPSEKVIDIAHQLCAGLAAAHAQRVLHRDLKPANILIDNDGRVRITDFGIAITGAEDGEGALIGTPGYMAPEQFERGAELSERTDIYALGVVLYELLTGQHPFDRSGTNNPTPPSRLVTDVSPSLDRAILQALAPDPRQRHPSAAVMAAKLPPVPTAGRRRNIGT